MDLTRLAKAIGIVLVQVVMGALVMGALVVIGLFYFPYVTGALFILIIFITLVWLAYITLLD